MKLQLVTPCRVSLLQRYGVTVRGNVTSVNPPLPLPRWFLPAVLALRDRRTVVMSRVAHAVTVNGLCTARIYMQILLIMYFK